MNHYVYEITNIVNGKKYIGKRSCHCPIEEDKYMGSGVYLKRAKEKYGMDNFKKDILQVCENEQMAFEWEKVYIEQFKAYENTNYYNISSGGEGGGFRVTCAGKSDSEIKAIEKKRLKKLIISMKNRNISGSKNPRAKKVICLNTGRIYDTIKDASKDHGTAEICISRCCNGTSVAYGAKSNNSLAFMYYDEYKKLSDSDIEKKLSVLDINSYATQKRKVILLNTLKVFDTMGDASKFIGKSIGTVCVACKDRKRSAGKINGESALWMYYDECLKMSKQEIENIFKDFKKSKEIKAKLHSSRIICLNNGEIFDKIKEAESKYSISNISANCRGKIKYAGKINGESALWMYYEDYLETLTEKEI